MMAARIFRGLESKQSRACAAHDSAPLTRTCIPNNVERRKQTASFSVNIRENIRNVEWLLEERLNAFKLIYFDSTCFNTVEREGGRGKRFHIKMRAACELWLFSSFCQCAHVN